MENVISTGKEIFYDGDKKLTVRRLAVVDVFKFAKLLAKVGMGAATDIAAASRVPEDADEDTRKEIAQQAGFQMFATLAEYEVELMDFLAGLTDKSLEEFKQLPPDLALDVVSTLAEGEDLQRFFSKARALAAKFLPQATQE